MASCILAICLHTLRKHADGIGAFTSYCREKHALAAINHNNITEMNVNVQTHFRQSLLEHAVHDGHQFGRDLCDVIVVVLERESETDVSSSHQRVRLVDT